MTAIALRLDLVLAAPVRHDRLHRLVQRLAAFRRHRRYPRVRLARARSIEQWAVDTVRNRA